MNYTRMHLFYIFERPLIDNVHTYNTGVGSSGAHKGFAAAQAVSTQPPQQCPTAPLHLPPNTRPP